MKSKNIQFEDNSYMVKSIGFFKANRLLFKIIQPLTPILQGLDTSDKGSLVGQILPLLKIELFEEILNTLLGTVQINGENMNLDDLDYDVAIELVTEAIKLNYSSLGKLIQKLKSLIPADLLSKMEEKMAQEMEETQNS